MMIDLGQTAQLIEIAAFVFTAIWGVMKIKANGDKLSSTMDGLNKSVLKLDERMGDLRKDLFEIHTRITRVETRLDITAPPKCLNFEADLKKEI